MLSKRMAFLLPPSHLMAVHYRKKSQKMTILITKNKKTTFLFKIIQYRASLSHGDSPQVHLPICFYIINSLKKAEGLRNLEPTAN